MNYLLAVGITACAISACDYLPPLSSNASSSDYTPQHHEAHKKAHGFYKKLNRSLKERDLDEFAKRYKDAWNYANELHAKALDSPAKSIEEADDNLKMLYLSVLFRFFRYA